MKIPAKIREYLIVMFTNEPLALEFIRLLEQMDQDFLTEEEVRAIVNAAIAELVGAAPESLNTLQELADALNDDANFASTVINLIGEKEDSIPMGTINDYYRGDKTWQVLDKEAVGLGNVDNTSDMNKPISNATQNALDAKANTIHNHPLSDITQSGAGIGQVPMWNGTEWTPETPFSTTVLVSSSSYDVLPTDYYIGVNYNGLVMVDLGTATNGKQLVIKDESGNCSVNNIQLIGTVDNDVGGAVMAIDNQSLSLIYRNGWRIV